MNTITNALPACFHHMLRENQKPHGTYSHEGGHLLSYQGATQLHSDYDALSERGCYISQTRRVELYAIQFENEHVMTLECSFFYDYVCSYDEALHTKKCFIYTVYLFTDYTQACVALTQEIANDTGIAHEDDWHA